MDERRISSLFLSYARADSELVNRVSEALEARGWKTWLDRASIPSAADWMAAIRTGIEAADGFVFIITPHSLSSDMCRVELSMAVGSGKRLLPLWPLDAATWAIDSEKLHLTPAEAVANVPAELKKLQYIDLARYLERPDPFGTLMDELARAAAADLEWLDLHTRLQQDAQRWVELRHATSVLLRGAALIEAEKMLTQDRDPPLTPLQREFVTTSRAEERRALEREASQVASRMLDLPAERLAIGVMLALEARERYLPTQRLEGALRTLLSRWLQRALLQFTAAVTSIKFTPAGELFAVGTADGTLQLFEAASGALVRKWALGPAIRDLAFTPDRQLAIIAHADGHLRALTLDTNELNEFPLADQPPDDFAVSQDGRSLIAAYGAVAMVVEIQTGNGYKLPRHPGRIGSVRWRTVDQVMTTCEDGQLRLFTLSQRDSQEFGIPNQLIHDVVPTARANTVVVAGDFQNAIVIDTESRRQLQALVTPSSSALNLTASENGERIVLQSVYGTVSVYDPTGHLLMQRNPFRQRARGLAFSADGSVLGVASNYGPARIFHVASQAESVLPGHDGGLSRILINRHGDAAITAGEDGTVRLWDLATMPGQTRIHVDVPVHAELSRDGSRIAVASRDGSARIFDRTSAALLIEVIGDADELSSATFTMDEETLVLAYTDGRIVFVNVSTGAELRSLQFAQPDKSSKAWVTADGKWIVIGRFPEVHQVLDARDGKRVEELSDPQQREIHEQWARQVGRWSDKGRIETTDDEGPPAFYVRRGEERIWLRSPEVINDACFAPGGAVIAGASVNEPEIRIFDSSTGESLARLWVGQPGNQVEFSRDGSWLLSVWLDSVTVIPYPSIDELVRRARQQVHRGLRERERAEFELPQTVDA